MPGKHITPPRENGVSNDRDDESKCVKQDPGASAKVTSLPGARQASESDVAPLARRWNGSPAPRVVPKSHEVRKASRREEVGTEPVRGHCGRSIRVRRRPVGGHQRNKESRYGQSCQATRGRSAESHEGWPVGVTKKCHDAP